MSDKYKVFKGDGLYFATFTIVDWLKVMEHEDYKQIIIDSLQFCQNNKGMVIYGYCIMPNHIHIILQATGIYSVSEILRDLKKFTSRAIVQKLEEEKPEGYQIMLNHFFEAGKNLKRIKKYKVWQDNNRAELLYSNKFMYQKLNYIHNNPVKAKFCTNPWEYKYSSAVNYSGDNGLIYVELLNRKLKNQ